MPTPAAPEPVIDRHIGGGLQARGRDWEVAGLAGRQYGVVSRAQLIALGFGRDAIDVRLRTGRLHLIHRGVYAVGHRVAPVEGRWLAAVLASGPGAVLSHRSAAALWGLRRQGPVGRVDVTTPRAMRALNGVRRHEVDLPTDEMTSRRRVPVTTLARTLFDLATRESVEGLEAAIRQAEYLHRFRAERLVVLLRRHPGRRGARTIRACLDRLDLAPRGRRRSKLEERFAFLLADTDLPKPELNVLLDLGGAMIEADCLWRDQRLIVELDGRGAHGTRTAFESDRERDRRLQVAGWRVVRITWRQLDERAALLADLRRLLLTPSL